MKKMNLAALLMAATLGLSLAGCTSAPGGTAASAPPAAPSQSTAPASAAPESAAPAADSDWAYIEGKGKMTIGYTVYEPMNYTDDKGEFVGFDTEFAKAVCAKLGVEPDFVEISWDTKNIELDSKNIDCIWNGMTITDDLKANISISDPYVKNAQVVVVKAENAEKYADTASLKEAALVAEAGSAAEGVIQMEENLKQAGYTPVVKQTDALMEIKAGTSDAAVLDLTLAKAVVGSGDFSDLVIVPGLELSVEEYGIGFRKGSDVTAMVNEAMAALVADGTLPALAEQYGLVLAGA